MAFTLQLGETAPDFNLPGIDGQTHALHDYDEAKVLIVVFACNHCPFVTGSEQRMRQLYDDYKPKGVEMVAINANETEHHPNDAFEHMKPHAEEAGITWPYLRDESQAVARAYGALRTPHFYVFDADRKLRYTGRMDDSPRDPAKATTHELRDALDDVLAGREVRTPLTNPIGCNVKWQGQEEHWMPPEACDLV
jgi:peroxiredoxin